VISIDDFCSENEACGEGWRWADNNCKTMAEVWDTCERSDWIVWVASRSFDLHNKKVFACWCVRQVWDLLSEDRKKAAECAELCLTSPSMMNLADVESARVSALMSDSGDEYSWFVIYCSRYCLDTVLHRNPGDLNGLWEVACNCASSLGGYSDRGKIDLAAEIWNRMATYLRGLGNPFVAKESIK